ncbi:MAG: hypothetical protein J7J92_00435 [Candidatus Aenigmarchaeota archaeon]|nr:hypothetical protein [Candidatus Aenigmarchaeota archaeon]
MKKIIPFLIIIILISGCVEQKWVVPDISVSRENEKADVNDIIVIKNVESYPKSPLMPSTSFYLKYRLENIDKTHTVTDVSTDIWDACMYKVKSNGFSGKVMYPMSIEDVQYSMKSPSVDEIANIRHKCDIAFYVDYKFEGALLYDVVVMNINEIMRVQESEKNIDIKAREYWGPGPVKLDAEFSSGENEPVIIGEGETKLPIKFTLKDVGSGLVKDNKIPEGNVHIYFPTEMVSNVDGELGTGNFSCGSKTTMEGRSYWDCSNKEEIKFFNRESSPIILYLTFNKNIKKYYKTFTIISKFTYNYELTKTYPVETIPYSV